MKRHAAVAVALLAFFFDSPAVGQACYTPITNWQAVYTMTGNGSGKDSLGIYNWTIDHQMSAIPNMPTVGASCTALGFGGLDTTASGSVNDHGTATCSDGSPDNLDITGGSLFDAAAALSLDLSGGTYQFANAVVVNAKFKVNSCGSVSTSSGPFIISPLNSTCTSNLNFPKFSLPATIGPLSQSGAQFSGGACPNGAVVSNWTLDFLFIPIYKDDDDCKKDGGSTVGCRNQSLGEDMGVVGTGMYLHYEGSRLAAAGADSVANNDALMIGGWTLSVHHAFDPANQTLYLGDGRQRNGYQLGVPVNYLGNTLLTSESGDEVYVFSPTGQHLQTLRPLTGAVLYQFAYDSAGNLVTVTDGSGNVTTIKRNVAEQATSIVSPYLQSTVLTMDSNGFLSQIKDPLGKLQLFTNTALGQIIARTDANGNTYNYTYDDTGRLIKDADPLGGYHALTRTNATTGVGWTVAHATAMGMTSSYQSTVALPWAEDPNNPSFSQQQTNVWPDGLQATTSRVLQNGQLVKNVTLPDGNSDSETTGPDPVWGLQAPVTTAATLTKGSLTMHTNGGRATTLGTAGNPFSVATETDTQTVNGRAYTSTFTGSNLTTVQTSPVQRAVTVVFDFQERVASTQIAGLNATKLAYTSKGKLASVTQGTRQTAFTYNSKGYLASASDPLKHKTILTYDADGRLLTTALPDGRVVRRTYDANGNLLTLTPPGKTAHTFTYTGVDEVASYTPPGGTPTTFAYDLDRRITSLVRPGSQTVTYDYDTGGRLTKVVTPTATETFTYSGTTGNIASAVRGTEHVVYSSNGPLLTKSTWTGTVAGNVSNVYNNNFWITSRSVNGGPPVAFKYDNDGLATRVGLLTIKRNPTNGLITGTTLGLVTDTRVYNSFGELTGYTATINGAAAYKYLLTLNADSMIMAKSETIGGVTNSYSHTYDLANRLTGATKNAAVNSYTYDTNSNRLTATTGSVTVSGTYDAQDRLLTYGSTSFTYTAAGDTSSQKTGTQTTKYTYDALGNLTAVTLPNGTKLTYVIDAENNRVGKTVNGVYTTGFLYDDDRIVAQLNASNQVVSQFVYAAGLGSPDYMISGGSTYRILHDAVGSPVLVVDTASGAIAQQITYDEFGNVLADTNPGFQPFGFAGGLYDQETKLVRFGARDYNPAVGRWTAKDPTMLSGGDTNLYDYSQADPVNHTDLSGLDDCKKSDRKKKVKKLVDKVIRKIAGDKVKVGPVSISTTKPEVSIGGSVELQVSGQTVAEAEGSVSVGVTPYPEPEKPLLYIDTEVGVKVHVGGKTYTIWENKTHTEVGHAKEWRPWVDGFQLELDGANKAACETCSDGVQPAAPDSGSE